MQMSRLMVWSTAFSDDERSETEYRLSADETSLTLSGLPPEKRDNSRDNIRTKHFINAKIHIFTQLSKRNQHRNRKATINATVELLLKRIPEPSLGDKSISIRADFLADACNVHIHRAGRDNDIVGPHGREQLLP